MNKNIFLFVLFFSFFLATEAMAKKVFIVASYEKTHVCGEPQEEGVVKGLVKQGWFESINLELARYHMDTKKTHTTKEAMKKQGEIALEKIRAFKPDVVVTIDDNAFREVGLKLVGDKDIKVVFSGLNGQPEAYNDKKTFMKNRKELTSNVVGIYEKLYASRSLSVMAKAVPDICGNKVIGITDFSPTGNAVTKQLELELKEVPECITWELKRAKDWAEYMEIIKAANEDDEVKAIYPISLLLKDGDKTYTAPHIFKWTIENSKKPEMALNYFFSKIGLFGGAAVDFKAMGFDAGKQAGMLLNDEKIENLSIYDASEYAIVFNLKRAKKLGLKIPPPLLAAADFLYK